jgi:hypothetical protein
MFELWSRFLGFRRFFSAGHFEPDIPRKFVRLLGVLETFSKRKKEIIAIGEIVNSAGVETRRRHAAEVETGRRHTADRIGRLMEQCDAERKFAGDLGG